MMSRTPLDACPFDYAIDAAHGRVLMHMHRLAYPSTQKEAVRQLSADPDYRPHLDFVIDCRRLDHLPDTNLVVALAHMWHALNGAGTASRWAIVSNAIGALGMQRMFAILTGAAPHRVQICRSRASAMCWLETDIAIDADDAPPREPHADLPVTQM
jgi:hypothetical protein